MPNFLLHRTHSFSTDFNVHIGNACNEMSVSANTKQNSSPYVVNLFVLQTHQLKIAELTTEAVGVFSVSVHGVSSASVLGFVDSRCGGHLTVQ